MKKTILFILLGITLFSCSNDDDQTINTCDLETLISPEAYENAASDELTINNLEINNNCLTINFSASGCLGDSWELKLIDKGDIAESLPAQRFLKLSLNNEELCVQLISRELTFDISNLQIDDNQVLLNITNNNESILYQY